jgi:hypothetical protein
MVTDDGLLGGVPVEIRAEAMRRLRTGHIGRSLIKSL